MRETLFHLAASVLEDLQCSLCHLLVIHLQTTQQRLKRLCRVERHRVCEWQHLCGMTKKTNKKKRLKRSQQINYVQYLYWIILVHKHKLTEKMWWSFYANIINVTNIEWIQWLLLLPAPPPGQSCRRGITYQSMFIFYCLSCHNHFTQWTNSKTVHLLH